MIQDLELITAFMEKSMKKENIVTRSNHLKAHTICNNNQLLAKNEGVVAAIHISQDPLCFMVRLKSLYWELINRILMDKNFIPRESKGGIDFYQYQYCEIPNKYEVYCTNPAQLWRKWWVKSRNAKKSIFDLSFLIRTRNCWYPIRNIEIENQKICVKTLGSQILLNEMDVVVWIQKSEKPSPNAMTAKKILDKQRHPRQMPNKTRNPAAKSTQPRQRQNLPLPSTSHKILSA